MEGEEGVSRNPWRYRAGDPAVVEVLIQNAANSVVLIDAEHHATVAPHLWHIDSRGYAATHVGERKVRMHVLLFPDIAPPRDHRNQQKLDNRSANMRSGANGINNRNTTLSDGGVYEHGERCAYVATWRKYNAKIRTKCFYWRDYASRAEAKAAAVEHRRVKAAKAEQRICAMQGVPIQRHQPKPKTNNTGVRGLSLCRANTPGAYIRAEIVINQHTHRTTFLLSRYANSQEAAMEAGREWLDATKAANPKQPRHAYKPRKKQRITE